VLPNFKVTLVGKSLAAQRFAIGFGTYFAFEREAYAIARPPPATGPARAADGREFLPCEKR